MTPRAMRAWFRRGSRPPQIRASCRRAGTLPGPRHITTTNVITANDTSRAIVVCPPDALTIATNNAIVPASIASGLTRSMPSAERIAENGDPSTTAKASLARAPRRVRLESRVREARSAVRRTNRTASTSSTPIDGITAHSATAPVSSRRLSRR